MENETDPSGLKPSDPGAKLDAGKPMCSQILKQFSRALWAVSEVGTYGAEKYSLGGWQQVESGQGRYSDAAMRHFLKEAIQGEVDDESELLHLAHEAWNKMAELELFMRERGLPKF